MLYMLYEGFSFCQFNLIKAVHQSTHTVAIRSRHTNYSKEQENPVKVRL